MAKTMQNLTPSEEQALIDMVKRFAKEEIAPYVTEWDAAGEFPRPLYQRASELGLLGLGYPEEFGGTPATHRMKSLVNQTFARYTGSGGVHASLYSTRLVCLPFSNTAPKTCNGKSCRRCCAVKK